MDEPKKRRRHKKQPEILHCSFCDKAQHEVRKLIAGPDVLICDECIDQCNAIIEDAELQEAKANPNSIPAYLQRQHKAVRRILDKTLEVACLQTPSTIPPITPTKH